MPLRFKPPAIPENLRTQFGEPEDVFGPNLRFRVVSVICGIVLIGMAIIYVVMSIGPNPVPLAGGVSSMLTVGLLVLGAFCIAAPRIVPTSWIFICPRGIIRARGSNWDAIGWDEIARFEDATLKSGITTIRQCRLVLKKGGEWGFLADWIGDYRKLTQVLRTKLEEQADGSSSPESA
jgi:hypothetical protein